MYIQCNALNSSPACYWFALFLCDLFLYGLLVGLMTAAMVVIMLLVAPSTFSYTELVVLPLLLIIFGAGCIPQAYLFSLSNRTALNTMIYVIINVVFGETTVLAKILYGDALSYALQFLSLSPQFNMGYALVKIKNIFLYNSECIVFEQKNHCASKMLHKCCPKCGVLQDCFSKKFYLTEGGILMEIIAISLTTIVFMVILLLWEYKSIQAFWKYISSNWIVAKEPVYKPEYLGAARERLDAINKNDELHEKNKRKVLGDTFGECLLAYNVTQIKTKTYSLRNIHLGLSRGEVLAVSGLKDHGRERLCQILAGYTLSNAGQLWCMSKWRADQDFHLYARQISYCGSPTSLPPWMTVYNGLELMAVLRGVPQEHIRDEVMNHIDALELRYYVNTLIKHVPENCRMRVRFAAAVVGAPPILILDECTAYQKYSVRRAMYAVISHLQQRGHAVLMSSSSVESHMTVTNRLAILLEGRIYDVDQVDNLVERFSARGYTVVVHLKDDVDVHGMFSKYFDNFIINDTSEVLVNVQLMDPNLNLTTIFEKMEKLQAENWLVYSYIVSAIPIDTVYNNILHNEIGRFPVKEKICFLTRFLLPQKKMIAPQAETLSNLKTFDERYSVTKLRQLPWSVIFQR